MPVKRREVKLRRDLPPEALEWLHDGAGGAWVYCFSTPDERKTLWYEYEVEILGEWVAKYPGTRPERWWECAPEGRRRLGGTGTPAHEGLGYVLHLHLGVPMSWITRSDIACYKRLGTPLSVSAVDPDDPPMFESEASYLKRLRFLLPGERRQLRQSDFEPESVFSILGLDSAEL